jgi:hypothetical protein
MRGVLLALMAFAVATGCGGDAGQCRRECEPACGEGWICSAEIRGHIGASWRGECLRLCAQPSDCSGGLRCRSFGDAPFVCASDSVPELCATKGNYIDDAVGDLTSCLDEHTIARTFDSTTNLTRGHELATCANGCETVSIDGRETSRCRQAPRR